MDLLLIMSNYKTIYLFYSIVSENQAASTAQSTQSQQPPPKPKSGDNKNKKKKKKGNKW